MIIDTLSVKFGIEITKIVPGYVSTEVLPRLPPHPLDPRLREIIMRVSAEGGAS